MRFVSSFFYQLQFLTNFKIFPRWILGAFGWFIGHGVQAFIPLLLGSYLTWLKDPNAEPNTGLKIALLLSLVGVVRSLACRMGMHLLFNNNLYISNTLRGYIFDSVLQAPSAAQKFVDIGRVSNLAINDVSNMIQSLNFSHNILVTLYCP